MSVADKNAVVECEIPAHDVEPGMQPCDIHVLLVDDEVLSRMVVSNMLVKCGYQVTAVETGQDALEKLAMPNQPFTLLMTDVAMPTITGLQILNIVRKTPELDHVPVVMMSAHQNAGTVFECVRKGADDYILKPVAEKEVHHLWQHVYRRQMVVKSRRRLLSEEISLENKDELLAANPAPTASVSEVEAEGSRKHPVADPAAMLGDVGPEKNEVMSVEEMRAYCNTMIEKYQKVLYVIDNYPELFPATKRAKNDSAAQDAGPTEASASDVDSLTKVTGDMTV